ncbi:hypothetical protein BD410DRAFT_756379 [Rickenella mellea]|uniref:EthD domain-containing protein n=1 Tax=Rickenella mellea TaxID=50990 RepID=A0A4Y7PKL0_9AGAM|nr:hypothetical protein BD410DRAFT_756379 [Rickenella mellea]
MTIRVVALIKKKEGMTHEEFSDYWGKNHSKIFTSLKAVKQNLIKYNQFHVLPKLQDEFASLGMSLAPYDGAAEFWCEKKEDIFALFSDEEYRQNAVPDEQKFLDRAAVDILVGEDQLKFQKA